MYIGTEERRKKRFIREMRVVRLVFLWMLCYIVKVKS